jgi:hypothetical protein
MVSVQVDGRVIELNRMEAHEFERIRKLLIKRESREISERTSRWLDSAKNFPSVIRRRLALRAINLDDGQILLTLPSSMN